MKLLFPISGLLISPILSAPLEFVASAPNNTFIDRSGQTGGSGWFIWYCDGPRVSVGAKDFGCTGLCNEWNSGMDYFTITADTECLFTSPANQVKFQVCDASYFGTCTHEDAFDPGLDLKGHTVYSVPGTASIYVG